MKQLTFYLGMPGHETDTETIMAETALFFDGATLTHSTGLWRGQVERSATLVVLTDSIHAMKRAATLARNLADLLGQEEVLWTFTQARAYTAKARIDASGERPTVKFALTTKLIR